MEITLEKIELVKDRTGVSYKEAKDALEAAGGSVVDAIIAIEETVDVKKSGKASEAVSETVQKIKELVKKGNVSKISIKKDEDTIVNIPVNVGVVGVIVAPWGVIAAAIAAFGFKCKIQMTTTDGKIIDISEKAEDFASDVVEKGAVVIDEVVAKGSDVVNDVKEKSSETYNNIKDAAADKYNEFVAKKGAFVDEDDAIRFGEHGCNASGESEETESNAQECGETVQPSDDAVDGQVAGCGCAEAPAGETEEETAKKFEE